MGSEPEGVLSPYHPAYRKDGHGSGGGAAAWSRMTREQQFLSELTLIERVIGWVCARRGLRGADADDFASVVKTRLVENDYEILGKFQGRSSLKTYLTAVINRLYLDFQVQRFGKWRSSAEAKRLGTTALRLECLMFRDGLSFDEACGVLKSDPRVAETRDALDAIRQRLPNRPGRVPKGDGPSPSGSTAAPRPSSEPSARRWPSGPSRSSAGRCRSCRRPTACSCACTSSRASRWPRPRAPWASTRRRSIEGRKTS